MAFRVAVLLKGSWDLVASGFATGLRKRDVLGFYEGGFRVT